MRRIDSLRGVPNLSHSPEIMTATKENLFVHIRVMTYFGFILVKF